MPENLSVLDAAGQIYKDFTITKYLYLNELQSSLVELVHIPTGARITQIANDDPENLFCLSFQTLPSSSNGVAHILEHTVLCGSEKFPVKDPFFAMTRRSLNTYMNALTGQDFTCYPASSQVEKDFYNLLEVYVDAVFHPKLREVSFLQEGHRLEFADPKNPKGPLEFRGVVYNEMKGAMSSIESRLWQALAKRLTPDLPYAHNSGGDPKEILSLSYEELLEFHREFYHPSRCLFFFYGNLPLSKHLDFLSDVLQNVGKISPLAPTNEQKRFEVPVIAEDFYPITEGEILEKKTQVAFSWLTVSILDQSAILALLLIDSMLCDTDASPLTMALLKSGLCTDVDSSIDVEMSEIPWTITCKGCDEKDADKLQEIIFNILQTSVFTKEEIEASLHQLEFERTEIGMEGIPFGLTLFFRSILMKQHGSAAETGLLIHTFFNELRERTQDSNYLPNLLRKYTVDNPHFVRLCLKPDPALEKKEREEEQKKLDKIRSSLNEEGEKKIESQMQALKNYQEEIEHQSLECLPKLHLKDVPRNVRDFPLQERGKVFYHTCFTNQILYADLIFDLPDIQTDQLPLLCLFSKLLPELGAGGKDYASTLAFQQAHIGSLDAVLSTYPSYENPSICSPTFSLRGKVLQRNAKALFQLFQDYVSKIDFDDRERIEECLLGYATELQEKLARSAMSYAVQTSLSDKSISSFLYNQWHGLPFYTSVLKWAKNCDSIIEPLKKMATQILGHEHFHLALSCSESQLENLNKEGLLNLSFPEKPFQKYRAPATLPKVEPEARIIAAPVAFTSLGMSAVSQSPFLFVSTELMENLVLHKQIREIGGAYGSGAQYTPSTGTFNFYSYRDPHLKASIDAFQKALQTIADMKFNERELEEAKLGCLQTLDAPVSPGNRARFAYIWKRENRNFQRREAFRQKVLEASKEEVADAVRSHLLARPGTLVSFLGKALFAKEKVKLPLLPI